jgi:hypothetical protein
MIRAGSSMLRNSISLATGRLAGFKVMPTQFKLAQFSMQLGNQFELDPSIPNYLKQSDFIVRNSLIAYGK